MQTDKIQVILLMYNVFFNKEWLYPVGLTFPDCRLARICRCVPTLIRYKPKTIQQMGPRVFPNKTVFSQWILLDWMYHQRKKWSSHNKNVFYWCTTHFSMRNDYIQLALPYLTVRLTRICTCVPTLNRYKPKTIQQMGPCVFPNKAVLLQSILLDRMYHHRKKWLSQNKNIFLYNLIVPYSRTHLTEIRTIKSNCHYELVRARAQILLHSKPYLQLDWTDL